ncbi:MAG: DUF3391 domain-containing protein [Comamonadaceae bacterium]|nr:DUF3391 domain-containing protein [Comamonadaceae bacterium]
MPVAAAMLKKIPVDQLRLGMHLHALRAARGSTTRSGRPRFVLDDPADLQRLRASSVRECWIDTARLDVRRRAAAAVRRRRGRAGARARPPRAGTRRRGAAATPPPRALDGRRTARRPPRCASAAARRCTSMFAEARLGQRRWTPSAACRWSTRSPTRCCATRARWSAWRG